MTFSLFSIILFLNSTHIHAPAVWLNLRTLKKSSFTLKSKKLPTQMKKNQSRAWYAVIHSFTSLTSLEFVDYTFVSVRCAHSSEKFLVFTWKSLWVRSSARWCKKMSLSGNPQAFSALDDKWEFRFKHRKIHRKERKICLMAWKA